MTRVITSVERWGLLVRYKNTDVRRRIGVPQSHLLFDWKREAHQPWQGAGANNLPLLFTSREAALAYARKYHEKHGGDFMPKPVRVVIQVEP